MNNTLFCSFYTVDFEILSAGCSFVNFSKNRKQVTHHNQICTWQKDHFTSYQFLLRNKMKENICVTTRPINFVTSRPSSILEY